MNKFLKKLILLIASLFVAFIYYYIALPAINIHSVGFWIFLFAVIILILAAFQIKSGNRFEGKSSKVLRAGIFVLGVLFLFFMVGYLLSSPIVNAKRYQRLLTVKDGDFATDIKELSFQQIPLLDRDSATLLGNRKMGSMVEYVSQFEVSTLYSQIDYQGKPYRVSPLVYASPIKWLMNQKQGIPAYISIDMATQNVNCVKLQKGIHYSQSEYFNRNINRHLRFRYPTYIFDTLSFELDDEGTPFWVCPVKNFTIGLFGGQLIGKVVLCNALTGGTSVYDVDQIPAWVDHVYSAELLRSCYDYYGTLKHGYLNSVLGQKDSLVTTNGYNYLVMDNAVWVYTGVTSVSRDESNVGFVLMNQRTKETRFYKIEGAQEESAMRSAEGQVQHLGYIATFPLILNIANQPTYLIGLKDAAGLVKMYAMVNIAKYQIVATGDSVAMCEKQYISLMNGNGIESAKSEGTLTKTGTISKMVQAVIDGNSHFYIMLAGSDEIFDVSVADNLTIIKYSMGDRITVEYSKEEPASTVTAVLE